MTARKVFLNFIAILLSRTEVFANDISYHCKLVERKSGHHGVVQVHGEGKIDIKNVVSGANPGFQLRGPHNTIASIGSYAVHTIPSEDYLGRTGYRKLRLTLSEKDPVSKYNIYYQNLVLSVDDGTIKTASLHRDLDENFLRIECKQLNIQEQ